MNKEEIIKMLEKRKELLTRKLESKKRPHFYDVSEIIIAETEAKLEEIETLLRRIKGE